MENETKSVNQMMYDLEASLPEELRRDVHFQIIEIAKAARRETVEYMRSRLDSIDLTKGY